MVKMYEHIAISQDMKDYLHDIRYDKRNNCYNYDDVINKIIKGKYWLLGKKKEVSNG